MGSRGEAGGLHINTPLVDSLTLSKLAGFRVLMKLDNAQPSASFKIRGIGHFIQKQIAQGGNRIVCSSGGNAGLAAAYAARKLNVPIDVIIPSTTSEFMKKRIELEGANVQIHGSVWDEANERAKELATQPGYVYVHPFEHPDVWAGHTSMIREIAAEADKPDLIMVSVGGGGLLCGIVQGMEEVGWSDVPVLCMETIGADCFNKAVEADKIVTLPKITSIANCLGALTVTAQAFRYYKEKGTLLSEVISDKECVRACLKFLDDERIMVEPACGATIAALYSGMIPRLQAQGKLGPIKTAVLIVCGGASVSMEMLLNWKRDFNL